jgi:uncharacterized membrane protein YccF (DUF307 family)
LSVNATRSTLSAKAAIRSRTRSASGLGGSEISAEVRASSGIAEAYVPRPRRVTVTAALDEKRPGRQLAFSVVAPDLASGHAWGHAIIVLVFAVLLPLRLRSAREGNRSGLRAVGTISGALVLRDRRQTPTPIGRTRVARVRLLLNLIWLIFGGLLMALGYAIVALVMFILIITIPFGIASARIALFCLWPFGRTLIRRQDAGGASVIGNLIWFVLAGWWLALGHLVTGLLMCVTIIGIPLGLANFKLIPVSLAPFGRDIVDLEQARRLGYAAGVTVPRDLSRRTT